MSKANDTEFQDHVISGVVDEGGDYFAITRDDGWSIGIPKDAGIVPKVGDSIRYYGKGIGSTVRGIDINGQEVWYRTPEQQAEHNRQELEKMEEEKRKKFAKAQSRLDLQYSELPRAFQSRLDRFRNNNPDFRVEFEDYEMMVCREAVKIAERFKTAEEIKIFRQMDWGKQVTLIPNLFDGHSGNTWGCACYLAHCYVTDPKLVQLQHGALCPLVGCKEYGCVKQEAPL